MPSDFPSCMGSIESRLEALGYVLPPASAPKGNYLPFRRAGQTLHLSGVLSAIAGGESYFGKVGEVHDVEAGYRAARVCALNALAAAKAALGSLDKVEHLVFVNGFVNGVSGFADSPKVINGASDFLVEVFGDAGMHARAAVAVAGLPLDATVELQVVLQCR